MSGPYRCTMCAGTGRVEMSLFDDHLEQCSECRGTGEAWLSTVFSPSRDDREQGRVEYVDGAWRFKEGHR